MVLEVQTRNAAGELRFFSTVAAALSHAESHADVWKISFNAETGERIRLVRLDGEVGFRFEPIEFRGHPLM